MSISGLLLFVPADVHAILAFSAVGRGNDNRLITGMVGMLEDKAHLVAILVLGVVLLIAVATDDWSIGPFMRHFMAGFFLVFSFFKPAGPAWIRRD